MIKDYIFPAEGQAEGPPRGVKTKSLIFNWGNVGGRPLGDTYMYSCMSPWPEIWNKGWSDPSYKGAMCWSEWGETCNPKVGLGTASGFSKGTLQKIVQDVPLANDPVNAQFCISFSHFWQEMNYISRVFNTRCSINPQELRFSCISKTFQLHSLVECGLPVPHKDEAHCLESG